MSGHSIALTAQGYRGSKSGSGFSDHRNALSADVLLYSIYRSSTRRTSTMPRLNLVGTINTLILLISSLTMALRSRPRTTATASSR
jgi:hypothetical protein